jgi:hypothetical protein
VPLAQFILCHITYLLESERPLDFADLCNTEAIEDKDVSDPQF